MRELFNGVNLIANGGLTREKATRVIAEGHADFVSFGIDYIASPDLVARFKIGAPLANTNWQRM